jgi:glycerol uptake facilitator protein
VVANVILPKTKGFGGGWLLINFGWGLGVFTAVYVAFKSGAHLNPAVTLGIWAAGKDEFAPGIEVNAANGFMYITAQFAGAAVGAALAYLAYKKHFDEDADPGVKLGVFSTGPELRSYGWNFVTEVIATFVLVFWVVISGNTPAQIGPLGVALVVVAIGASIGGPTGYAINPARDLGPRIAHALLPIKGKGSSDWGYAWVPVLGPAVGGILGGLAAAALGWVF